MFTVLRGYIDESYDGKKIPDMFCLTCTMAAGDEWPWIEMAWVKRLEEKNASLIAKGRKPISRYHSVTLNSFQGEFKDWNGTERTEFCKKLMEVFRYHAWGYEGYLISIKELVDEWPETKSDPIAFAYYVLLKFMMGAIGKGIREEAPDYNITLFYERCPYGGALLDAFEEMMEDPGFSYRELFTTIGPVGWEKCIPLQPADLIAYENFKEGLRTISKQNTAQPQKRRMIFSELISYESFVPRLRQVTRANIRELRSMSLARRNQKIHP